VSDVDFIRVRIETDVHPHLQVARVAGREAIACPFEFEVDVVTVGEPELDPRALLGQKVALVFEENGSARKRLHAIVIAVRDELDAGLESARYRLRLAPRLHGAQLTETYEVFLDQSIPDIIRKKLARAGLGPEDASFRLVRQYPARDFVLQYAESDLAFVSRLAEHAGIAYRFEHGSGRDVVVFSDTNQGLAVAAVEVPFTVRGDPSGVFQLARETAIFPGRHVVDDYNDQHPRLDLHVEQVVDPAFPGEVVEWGAGYTTAVEGKRIAIVRSQERVCAHRCYRGACGRPLGAGDVLEVTGHPRLPDARLRVTDVEHSLVQSTLTHAVGADARRYTSVFRAVPESEPFRPERRTPRPRIDGFVHAITEPGPPGVAAVAQLDDQGRYTVQFLFDRADRAQRRVSSARVRLMQQHAGPNYGIHFPLKPGVEVLVAFIDGDPDRPVIAGCVPNVLTASPVTARNPLVHAVETQSGVYIRMKDG
jgi:type VI secretion system secreted protein VgrG